MSTAGNKADWDPAFSERIQHYSNCIYTPLVSFDNHAVEMEHRLKRMHTCCLTERLSSDAWSYASYADDVCLEQKLDVHCVARDPAAFPIIQGVDSDIAWLAVLCCCHS